MKLERVPPSRRANLRRLAVVVLLSLCFPAVLPAQDSHAVLRKRADVIRASADRLFKLQRIPWVTDPAEGFRLAREENRPVFLYVQTGDPLEDC